MPELLLELFQIVGEIILRTVFDILPRSGPIGTTITATLVAGIVVLVWWWIMFHSDPQHVVHGYAAVSGI